MLFRGIKIIRKRVIYVVDAPFTEEPFSLATYDIGHIRQYSIATPEKDP